MSQMCESSVKGFTAGAAIGKYIRVKLVAGKLAVAGVADDWIGVTMEASFADGDKVAVRLRTAVGTLKVTAAGAVTASSRVYAAASGKVDDAITTELIGIALEAAGADGDVFEVMPLVNGQAYRIARGQTTTATASDTVVTGLNTVIAAVANLEDAPVLACDRAQAVIGDQAGTPAAGSILIKTFKPTGTGDATPIAATTFTKKVNWLAIGT